MRRLLIAGSRGFVGGHLKMAAGCMMVCDDAGLDITDPASVRAVFERERPDAVALLAAVSDIDRCQRERELARRVNVDGAVNVARECVRGGAHLIFASSGAVFDGARHGYTEADPPSPISVYGETKARAEAEIGRRLPGAAIVRLSLVLGFARRDGTNSLLNKLAAGFRTGRRVAAPVDEFRNPVDVRTVAECFLWLAASDHAGVWHLGSTATLSRYDLVMRLAARMGYPETLVTAQTAPIPGRAPRGRDHFLIPGRLRALRPDLVLSTHEFI